MCCPVHALSACPMHVCEGVDVRQLGISRVTLYVNRQSVECFSLGYQASVSNNYLCSKYRTLSDLFPLITWPSQESMKLLKNILPESIIARMQSGQNFVADSHQHVVILFSGTPACSLRRVCLILHVVHLLEQQLVWHHALSSCMCSCDGRRDDNNNNNNK